MIRKIPASDTGSFTTFQVVETSGRNTREKAELLIPHEIRTAIDETHFNQDANDHAVASRTFSSLSFANNVDKARPFIKLAFMLYVTSEAPTMLWSSFNDLPPPRSRGRLY